MKQKIIILMMMVTPVLLFAETKPFYCGDEAGDNEHLWYMKDGTTLAPEGLYIQKCISDSGAVDDHAAPTTNEYGTSGNIYGNFLPGAPGVGGCQEYQVGTCVMGQDQSGMGGTVKPGTVSGPIGSSDTTRRAWFRCFSATTIKGAVYYGDTLGADAARTLNNTVIVYEWSADPINNIINPAYVITFSSAPAPKSGETFRAVGTVANVGNGNNQMPNDFLEVVYSGPQSGTAAVAADGSFEFTPSPITAGDYDVYVKVKDASTPRNGFPLSGTEQVTLTPEPGIIGMIALGALAFFRKK